MLVEQVIHKNLVTYSLLFNNESSQIRMLSLGDGETIQHLRNIETYEL